MQGERLIGLNRDVEDIFSPTAPPPSPASTTNNNSSSNGIARDLVTVARREGWTHRMGRDWKSS